MEESSLSNSSNELVKTESDSSFSDTDLTASNNPSAHNIPKRNQVVRAKTILTESSLSSGRAQPSDSPVCAHYSNKSTKSSNHKKRKATASHTVLEYNLYCIPRILKNDLRRQYPVMFMNVFNSADYDYMMNFLETFCSPNLKSILESHEPNLYQKLETEGYDDCGKKFFERMTDSADVAFALKDVQMKVRSDGTCALHSKFEIKGNKVLYVDPRRVMNIFLKIFANAYQNSLLANDVNTAEQPLLVLPSLPDPPALTAQPSSSSSTVDLPDSSQKDCSASDESLFTDSEFLEAFEDCYKEEKNDEAPKNPNFPSASESSTLSNQSDLPQQENETDNDYLYRIFERAMNLDRDLNTPRSPEETLAVAFPYNFVGEFVQHVDLESKVYLTHFTVRVNR